MHNSSSITRRGALLVVALLIAVALAACGSSSSTKSSASAGTAGAAGGTSTARAAFTKYTACLKSHGVTLPNGGRFRGGGGTPPTGLGTGTSPAGGTGTIPSGGTPPTGGAAPTGGLGVGAGLAGNPKFAAARKACASDLPKGLGTRGAGGFAGGGAAFTKYQTEYESAVKTYAACVTTHGYTMPKPDFTRGASVFPASVESNAKFKAASKSCTLKLPARPSFGTGAPGAGGAPPTST